MTHELPPTISEELARKTVDVLETLVHRAENGRMDKRELAAVAKALWNVTAGLVDDQIQELCAAVADSVKTQTAIKRHFIGKGSVVTFAWLPDKPGYVMGRRDASTGERAAANTVRHTDIGQREAELQRLFDTLGRSGYRSL